VATRTVYERGIVAAFFVALAIVGLLVYDEYGIAWDEPGLVHYGNLLLEHFGPGGDWETYINLRFYGPVGPVLLALTDRLTGGPAFPAGHLTNFGVYFAGVAAFYALCRFQFRDRMWGLLGAAFLVLSPRLFSHGFVNPKDVPLMSAFVIAVYLLVRFLDSGERKWIVWCGVATAFATGVRVTGLFLGVLAFGAIAADVLARRERAEVRRAAVSFALFAGVTVVGTVAMWPFLWENPLARFYEAATVMSNLVEGPGSVLHLGEVVPVTDIPWHYLPVWIGVTTPPLYLVLTFTGVVTMRWQKRFFVERDRERFFYLYLAWALVPLVALAVLRPPLYDEWRQVLFVYPPMLMLAVAGARWVAQRIARASFARPGTVAVATFLGAALLWNAGAIVRLHPYQTAYFNVFAGDKPEERFDVDYWGLSYKEGLDRLLNAEPGEVRLFVCSGPGLDNADMIDRERRARLVYVDTLDEAQYTLCAPRASLGEWAPGGEPLFTVERDGIPLLVAHRR
jgi:hypothetical protein